jgi:hypothetical protein
MFHKLNQIIPSLIDEMTVFERTEIIKLILRQQDRRRMLGTDLFSCSDITLLSLQSDNTEGDEPGTHTADTTGGGSSGDLEVTVRYLDENPGTHVNFNPITDNTFYSDYVPDSDIQSFLSRPLKIASYSWAEGASLAQNFNPWDLFFNTTQVKKKLDNFQWLSCNLNIKVLINASPFYYGAVLVSYRPLTAFKADSIKNNPFGNNSIGKLSGCSTRPHFWVYPQTNQGGEMRLPFLYFKNWLNINVRSEFQNMGNVTIESAVNLLNANSATGNNVTLSVFAWATDVRLSGPTINLALQSQELDLQADEYDGPISGIASNIAKISSVFEAIPMIAPFAKATTMISSGIASLSSLFGFTNVPVIDPVAPMKNLPFHSFASTEISQPIEKLSLDPKQELSIDNRIAGIGPDDELLISNIIQRDCLLNISTWTAAQVAGDKICKGLVLPYNINFALNTGVPTVQGTPISHVACLFKNWRGDIIYRFRFICSKFHRGRVVVQWDPNGDIDTTNPDTNLVYSQIIDISEETDVEFRVPYMQATPWQTTYCADLPTDPTRLYKINFVNGAGTLPTYEDYSMNGRITMRVLTQQTSPVDSADIYVLTSIRAADNLEFANPVNPPQYAGFMDLQSELVEYNSPDQYCISDKPIVIDDNRYLVNFGEQVRSLRQVLRRVSYSRSQTFGADTTSLVYQYYSIHSPIPLYRGFENTSGINSAKGVIVPASDFPYNFVNITPLNWMFPCYVGYRGGMNWHYNITCPDYVDHMRASRYPQTSGVVNYSTSASLSTTANANARAKWFNENYDTGSSGQSLLNQKTQSGLSVYYPMYNRVRFFSTDPKLVTVGSSNDESNKERCKVEAIIKPSSTTRTVVASSTIDFYAGIGTDFSLIFFLNIPSFYVYVNPAAT